MDTTTEVTPQLKWSCLVLLSDISVLWCFVNDFYVQTMFGLCNLLSEAILKTVTSARRMLDACTFCDKVKAEVYLMCTLRARGR